MKIKRTKRFLCNRTVQECGALIDALADIETSLLAVVHSKLYPSIPETLQREIEDALATAANSQRLEREIEEGSLR